MILCFLYLNDKATINVKNITSHINPAQSVSYLPLKRLYTIGKYVRPAKMDKKNLGLIFSYEPDRIPNIINEIPEKVADMFKNIEPIPPLNINANSKNTPNMMAI